MTSKADKLPLDTEPVAHDNNKILKPGDQTFSHITQLIIIVSRCSFVGVSHGK